MFPRLYNYQCNQFQNIFISLKETTCPLAVTSHFPSTLPAPRQLPIYFLLVWICLFQTFCINGITRYVVFCDWILSLSIIFHFVAGISICLSLTIAALFHCGGIEVFSICMIPHCGCCMQHAAEFGTLGRIFQYRLNFILGCFFNLTDLES